MGQRFQALALADRAAPGAAISSCWRCRRIWSAGTTIICGPSNAPIRPIWITRRRRAVRCAFWLGFRLFLRGEVGRATGWFARAQRLLEGDGECAEQGYLLVPVVDQQIDAGELEAAYECAARAADNRRALRRRGPDRLRPSPAGPDTRRTGAGGGGAGAAGRGMVAVTAGELSLIMTGLMYCGVIQACMSVYAIGRAREWTAALTRWCEPEIAPFTGVCRVHRAEILLLHGDWQGAIEEAQRARERAKGTSSEPRPRHSTSRPRCTG